MTTNEQRAAQLETLRRKMHAVVNAYIDNLIDDNDEMDNDDRAQRGDDFDLSDAFADVAATIEISDFE